MKKGYSLILAVIYLAFTFKAATLAGEAFGYPCYLVDAYDADDSCWTGMDIDGNYGGPTMVVPEQWLVGPPLSEKSGVTLPPDHWVELQFRGPIINGPGDDIKLIELGPVSEQALIFLTDAADQEKLIDIATSGHPSSGVGVDPTHISFDISGIDLPFEPRAIRILGLDYGGEAHGFDIASVQARICTDCGEAACNPLPVDGAKNVSINAILSWSTGQFADKHIVHLGTDISDIGTSGFQQPQDANTFDPGSLELGTTYYWRIDEVNGQNVWPGEVWSFTTTDYLVIDDFEQYNSSTGSDRNKISDTWKNTNVGLSENYAHKCSKKSMAIRLRDYSTGKYTENVVRTFTPPQDWTATGMKALELFFSDITQNSYASSYIYIALNDGNNEAFAIYPIDSNNITNDLWYPWRIDLQEFQDIDLSNIESMEIGFYSDSNNPSLSFNDKFLFDDIRLYTPRCLKENISNSDFNSDCLVNYCDLEEMTSNWLDTGYKVYPVAAPNAPVAWYEFDDNVNDSAGNADGPKATYTYTQGVFGKAISFNGSEDVVKVYNAADTFSKISKAITIAFWQIGADSQYHTDTLFCTNYTYGSEDPAIAIHLGCWRRPGVYHWACGSPWSFDNKLSGKHRYPAEWFGRWNHWAFTKDADTGVMQIFLNGALYASRTGSYSPISGITSFEIGNGWYGGYDGAIDDFLIYDYALTGPEIAYIATDGTGIFDQRLLTPADLNDDNKIDFGDFALLADHWLENQIWP
ncbi:MAG: hypothetical protein JXA81_00620 [Sedimentisphaerales bacterium]|nr:hypothetical protein [Sedimentisphaerales bacterium]